MTILSPGPHLACSQENAEDFFLRNHPRKNEIIKCINTIKTRGSIDPLPITLQMIVNQENNKLQNNDQNVDTNSQMKEKEFAYGNRA